MVPEIGAEQPGHEGTRGPKGQVSCLFLHGLGGGPHELAPLIEAFRGRGVPVAAPVLPGHEVSGRIMPASYWRDWLITAEDAFDRLEAGGQRVAVIGFSTGGTLALELATRRAVDRLVLLAPFLAIRHSDWLPFRSSFVVRFLARLCPDFPRRRSPVREPGVRRSLLEIERFGTFSLHATASALELIERVKLKVGLITVPTLIIQGKLDSVVEPRAVAWLYDNLGSVVKQLVVLPRSDHLVALDWERDQVLELATHFALRGQELGGSAEGQ